MIETAIGLRETGWPNQGPFPVLLPKPRTTEEERSTSAVVYDCLLVALTSLPQTVLFVGVMSNLRTQVKALEDDEIFEASALRNLNPAFEEQPSSNDIDSIMQSLMGSSLNAKNPQLNRMNPASKVNGNDSGVSKNAYNRVNANGRH